MDYRSRQKRGRNYRSGQYAVPGGIAHATGKACHGILPVTNIPVTQWCLLTHSPGIETPRIWSRLDQLGHSGDQVVARNGVEPHYRYFHRDRRSYWSLLDGRRRVDLLARGKRIRLMACWFTSRRLPARQQLVPAQLLAPYAIAQR